MMIIVHDSKVMGSEKYSKHLPLSRDPPEIFFGAGSGASVKMQTVLEQPEEWWVTTNDDN